MIFVSEIWESIQPPFSDDLKELMKANVKKVCSSKRKEERAKKKANKEKTQREEPQEMVEMEIIKEMEPAMQ